MNQARQPGRSARQPDPSHTHRPSDRHEAEADAVARRSLSAPSSEDGVRRSVGGLLGYDFSGVRLHRDAAMSGTHAETAGGDVYLAPGRYRLEHPLGRALLAHELTHVAQQGAAPRLGQPAGYRSALDAFGATHPSTSLAAQRAALGDPGGGLTVAPRGMRQRCVFGCTCSGDEEEAGTPPPAGTMTAPLVEHAEDAGPKPAGTEIPGTESGKGVDTGDAGTETGEAEKAAAAAAVRIAGAATPTDPYRIIHVAWTMDDGPTPATPQMKATIADRPTTWFIMRNQLGTGTDETRNLNDLKDLQAKGHEIAIHSSHPTQAHVAWFPVEVAPAVPKAYATVAEAMAHLTEFVKLLKDNGIQPKFVRMPGGEITEVSAYLKDKGVSDAKQRSELGRKILKQESVSAEAAGVQEVAADYNTIRATLDALGLKLWGGSAAGPMISAQSWEAESSGSGLADNVTEQFKKVVDAFGTVKRERSLIVLAHDTNEANAKEVAKDVKEMEDYAAANGVQIQYHTMSSLFQKVRGYAP